MTKYLTIDVGGTNIKYALMDEQAVIYEKGEVPTPTKDAGEFVETLGQIYDRYAGEVQALAMSAPGRIDSSKGFFYTGGALQFIKNTDVAGMLKDRIPVPFCAENDAKSAALAELWKGSLKGYRSGSVIVLGTGIGGAIILDGKLVRGETFAAGEYSGIAAHWDSKVMGTSDNWANVNSTKNLVATYAKAAGLNASEIDGRYFFAKANEGDETAVSVLKDFCAHLATGIYSLQLILDVQRFCIGGGISKQPVLMKTLQNEVDDLFARVPFYSPAAKPEIASCTFGNDANMIGALYHYLYEVKAD